MLFCLLVGVLVWPGLPIVAGAGDPAGSPGAVVFLDNGTGVVNGSRAYDPETRSCGSGSATVYTDLEQAAQALVDADVLYVREGTYSRESVGNYITVHDHQVNYWTGALAIGASGTPGKHKLVSAYKDEKVIIQPKPGVSAYNPDPSDETFTNSSHFYPHPAISVGGSFVDVVGFKTYGQVLISGHDVTLTGCDIGGAGPHMNQGQAVVLNSNRPGGVHDVVIGNNLIHHSSWGESAANGAGFMGYNFSCVIEHNEFFDNYGADIRIKDTGGQEERDIAVRYNVFRPTTINPNGNAGFGGIGQDGQVRKVFVYGNMFFHKATGIDWNGSGLQGTFAYNNAFVDCGTDVGTWLKPLIHVANNLYYHSRTGQKFYDVQADPLSKLSSDWNLFFSTTGDTQWRNLYRSRGTTLADWQAYSGCDQHAVWKDPAFVNPSGSDPEDFKRKGNPQDVTGSEYGPVCGAYVTGDEVIGIEPGANRYQDDY
jgi:hypothetical protein